jgi:hypothetical protein
VADLIIVDTSVWIDYFRGDASDSIVNSMRGLLDADSVAITDVIRHELVVGAATSKDYQALDEMLSALREYSLTTERRAQFNHFAFQLKKQGLLGKYTDASIALLAKVHHCPVFTLDRWFHKLADKKIIQVF